MTVTLIGLGGGTADTLTAEARRILEQAEPVIGAGRLLEALPATDRQTPLRRRRLFCFLRIFCIPR